MITEYFWIIYQIPKLLNKCSGVSVHDTWM